ncbi:hypothetical protein ARMGADRAFT_1084591 [Armillaria gallica]|uniref:Uncharacterized protein n=1 Tax=Armillaria gallica TaxID=47427 RepID=A0A2H3DHT6_ARMGA|nr:hypothetical protein ARMGADRAFT_1084591 [Armillaria gallica]
MLILKQAEEDGIMAIINSFLERYATMHALVYHLFTNYPSLPFPYTQTRGEVSALVTALLIPVTNIGNTIHLQVAAPITAPLIPATNTSNAIFPPPPSSTNSTRPSSPDPGCMAPPASPNTVEAFLKEVGKETKRRLAADLDFWLDGGNDNLVLPVPEPVR